MLNTQTLTLFAAVLAATGVYADPVQITLTAQGSSQMGFSADQTYTFTWTVSDEFTGGPGDRFDSTANIWAIHQTTDPVLFNSVTSDGLGGTYNRPDSSIGAPYCYVSADSSSLYLFAGDDAGWDQPTMGLTANGANIISIDARNLEIPGLDVSDTAFVNPADWLAGYAGTYELQFGLIMMEDDAGNAGFLNPSTMTIGVIPEPATMAFIGIFGGSLLTIRRLFPPV